MSSTRADVGTSVTGTFEVNNGSLSIPKWPRTDHVSGMVVVEPDRIHVSRANGVYDGIPVEVTKGELLLKESGAWADVEIEGQVPAEKVWDFIRDFTFPSSASSNWQTWNVVEGNGLLRLRFSGEVFEAQGLTFQYGEYQPTNVVLEVPSLPHPLSNGHGKVLFSPESTVLERIEGDMGAYPFTLNGTIIHQNVLRVEPLTVTAGFDGQELLMPSEPSRSKSQFRISGPLYASVTMRGPINRLNFKGKVDGEEATFTIPAVMTKGGWASGGIGI